VPKIAPVPVMSLSSPTWRASPKSMNATLPELRADLQPLIDVLLAKQPKDRPASARLVVHWLDQWLAANPP
jgi:hypothetical protein